MWLWLLAGLAIWYLGRGKKAEGFGECASTGECGLGGKILGSECWWVNRDRVTGFGPPGAAGNVHNGGRCVPGVLLAAAKKENCIRSALNGRSLEDVADACNANVNCVDSIRKASMGDESAEEAIGVCWGSALDDLL
jgi:hypothetical protein